MARVSENALTYRYDIFSGELADDALWLEAVDGLDGAIDRMNQCATEKPGRYFVYKVDSQTVVASIDTIKYPHAAIRKPS